MYAWVEALPKGKEAIRQIDYYSQPEGWEDFHRADPKHSRFGNI